MRRSSAYGVVTAHFFAFVFLGLLLDPLPWNRSSIVLAASAFVASYVIERRYLKSGGKHVLNGLLGPVGPFYLPAVVALATFAACGIRWELASGDPSGALTPALLLVVNWLLIESALHDRRQRTSA